MTRQYDATFETINRRVLEANIRHAHILRAQTLAGYIVRAYKTLFHGARTQAAQGATGNQSTPGFQNRSVQPTANANERIKNLKAA